MKETIETISDTADAAINDYVQANKILVSRKWILLLSIFILLDSLLLGVAIYAQYRNSSDIKTILVDLSKHTQENAVAIKTEADRNNIVDERLKAQNNRMNVQRSDIDRISDVPKD
jgi:uncharacterized membrane protein